MDDSVLYRLVLARTFFDAAAAQLQHSDPHSLAVAVVNTHDALDNFFGALATDLDVHVADDLPMIRTYDKIGSAGHSLGSRVKIAQLNALRNDIKHQGLHPNPAVVSHLVAELRAFADETAEKYFGRPLSRIRLVDAIHKDSVRTDMAQVASMIESAQYRDALEAMAYIIYEVYESQRFEFLRSLTRNMSRGAVDHSRVDFPKLDRVEMRVDFVELGINPEEYEQFHYVVPRVGVRGYDDAQEYVLEKSRSFWHPGNFTRETCEQAFDFLLRFITARERRRQQDTFARRHPIDKITFVRDSAVFEVRDRNAVLRTCDAGEEFHVSSLPFVDGEWQNYGDDSVFVTIYDQGETIFGYIRKADVVVTPDVAPVPGEA